jgi:2-hydroxycyclohexanecarboxyl-CoA dehydrogenase
MAERLVALVTGSSRDIGRATALRLAADGVDVAIHSVATKDLGEAVADEVRASGVNATYVQADVRSFEEVASLVDKTRRKLGPINILVNSAGWTEPSNFEENTPEYWDKIVKTKFYGFIHTVFHAYPDMKAKGWGKIVNIAGESGRIGISQAAVHSGVQGGIIAMTKSWAREFAAAGVRVNCVCPGPVDTTEMPRYEAKASALFAPGSEMTSVLGRATPDDIASTVAFLARPESDKITGQILSVSGGRSFAG